MSEKYISDNAGHRVAFHPNTGNVKAASCQKLTGFAVVTFSVTVTGGKRYLLTAQRAGTMILGVADVVTEANIRWVCPIYKSLIMTIPHGETTLYYRATQNGTLGYLRELED